MKRILVVALFGILFWSCDSNSPVSPIEQPSDEWLTSRLVYSEFKYESYEADYLSDNTFVEKSYIYNESNIKTLWYTRTGSFEIKDAILYKNNCIVEFKDSTKLINGGISIIFFDAELSVVDNKLDFNRITVLNRISENSDDIWGSWETTKWVYHFVDEPRLTYQGQEEYFYNFYPDSSKVHYGWRYLGDSDFEDIDFHSDFTYSPPHLELVGPGECSILVNIENNKMLWRYDDHLKKTDNDINNNCSITIASRRMALR